MPAVPSFADTPSPGALLGRLRRPGAVLLAAARADLDTGRAGALLFDAPAAVLEARGPAEVGPLLAALDDALAHGRYVAGFLAYEAGYALDPGAFPSNASARRDGQDEGDGEAPRLAWFGVYDAPTPLAPGEVEAALALAGPAAVRAPRFALSPEAYAARIDAVRAHIRAGDVYQINLTAPLHFGVEGDVLGLYAALRARQRVPYGACLTPDGAAHVLSCSPELFWRLDGDRLTARPMKGTAPRGPTPDADAALARGLAADPKNRAENLMIVDLLRNDLGRVAQAGSVAVPHLFATEPYETVTQMTSTVTARLRSGATVGDVMRALFPCGSVTGAPKLRAMRRIAEIEDAPRGVYCGAIGFAGPEGAAFSVPIRTAVVRREGGALRGTLGIGSGVVWDSEAASEYAECLLKARFLTDLAR